MLIRQTVTSAYRDQDPLRQRLIGCLYDANERNRGHAMKIESSGARSTPTSTQVTSMKRRG